MRVDRKEMSDKKFKELLVVNGVQWKHTKNGNIYWGIKRKATDVFAEENTLEER
jgi:hypothetical protein